MKHERRDEKAGDKPGEDEKAEQGPGPVRVPITGELDLHAFAPRDIPSLVEEYVRACRAEGITLVRLVHGRGQGVQRAEVQRTLARLPEVVSFTDAAPASGGWGATVAWLRPSRKSGPV